jgi:hypothetical protein
MVARLSFTISERASLPACLLCLCLLHLSLSLFVSLASPVRLAVLSPSLSLRASAFTPRARASSSVRFDRNEPPRTHTRLSLSLSLSLSFSRPTPSRPPLAPARARVPSWKRACREFARERRRPSRTPPPPSRTASLDRRVGGRGGERGDKATRWSPGEISAIGPSNNRDVPSRASRARDTTLPAITRRDTPRG